jgi:hypothetical protein
MNDINVQVTLRPGEEVLPEDSLQPQPKHTPQKAADMKEASPPQSATDTTEEQLRYAIADACKQKPEFCGRFCNLCNDTTAHFRLRGVGPEYVKTAHWMCTACFLPGGYVYEIVKSLINRQGERPTP